ncbi:antibiotic biosynthesis monooxygenase family protein [Parasphingorhabdus sp. DH2-15]|uniref:antibiotic biosynthesis monooxygenase family protein n=1 Tax=Parasphingorhabdus sp. DH2-15 TaxID=3444112 RepID=UPI003F6855DC
MIVEQAVLEVAQERAKEFEHALRQAKPIIAAQKGFRAIRILRSAEDTAHYLLLVEWDDIDAHRVGFRQSADYDRWRSLLHGFYAEMPSVRYFGDNVLDV